MNPLHILHLSIFGVLLIILARRLPGFALTRPVSYSMIIGLIMLTGIVSLTNLPLELMPDVSYGNITIYIDIRGGMPPPDVERLVTKPVEEAMASVSKMKNIISSSKKNKSVVSLEFDPGTNMSLATLEVREKFLKVKPKLPKEIERPIIARYEESDAPVVIAALTSDTHTPEELRRIVEENLKERLLRISGVANVEIGGGRERKILVNIDKNRLAALGIPIKKVVAVLEQNNLNIQVGELKGRSVGYGLRAVGAFRSVGEIENIGISVSEKGGIVRLKDIAGVKDSYLEAESYSRLNSKAAVTLYIQKESLTNTVKVAEEIRKSLNNFKSKLDKNTQMLIVSDQSTAILGSLNSVKLTMMYGIVLVILVLSMFLSKTAFTKTIVGGLFGLLLGILLIFNWLGIPLESSRWIVAGVLMSVAVTAVLWRKDILPSFVVAFTIPVSVFITLVFMYFEKFTLNVISLSGLVLGIGLLVDNSIVVLENYDRIRKIMPQMATRRQIEQAAAEMVAPMIGGTLTTIVVFLPFFLLQKQTQILYGGIAFTVIASLLASLFSALSLVPALSLRFGHAEEENNGISIKIMKKSKMIRAWILNFYNAISRKISGKKYKILAAAGILAGIILVSAHFAVKVELGISLYLLCVSALLAAGLFMFSNYARWLSWCLDRRKMIVGGVVLLFLVSVMIFVFKLPKDFMTSSEQNEFVIYVELASGVRLDISDQIVKEVEKKIREMPDTKDMIKGISSRVEGWSSKVYVTLAPRAERSFSTQQIIDKMRRRFKGIGEKYDTFIYFSEPISGKEIFVEVFGQNYDTLSKLAMQVATEMGRVKGFSDIKVRYRPGQPEATVMLDPERVPLFGLDNKEISETLHAQMRGLRATSFYDKNEEVETIVRISPSQCASVEQLKSMLFVSPYGFQVPVEHLSRLVFGLSPSEIWHRNKSRMIQVSANLSSMPLSEAAKNVKDLFKKVSFPEEYYADIGGDYDEMVKANRELWQAMAVTILLIFVVLACQFESLSQPFIIMITVLLSGIGGVAALSLTKSTVTLGVSVGMLMLCGIVVNNGIMLVDKINTIKERDKGILDRSIYDIIIEASGQRRRPIMMTTITTVLGLLPMAMDRSESSVLWSPLALTVIGGLLTSTILTLFIVPCFYIINSDVKKFVLEKYVFWQQKMAPDRYIVVERGNIEGGGYHGNQ
ncbi:MAG: efflux RND transporter permease subunit [Elusimicrobiota bacterium]